MQTSKSKDQMKGGKTATTRSQPDTLTKKGKAELRDDELSKISGGVSTRKPVGDQY